MDERGFRSYRKTPEIPSEESVLGEAKNLKVKLSNVFRQDFRNIDSAKQLYLEVGWLLGKVEAIPGGEAKLELTDLVREVSRLADELRAKFEKIK